MFIAIYEVLSKFFQILPMQTLSLHVKALTIQVKQFLYKQAWEMERTFYQNTHSYFFLKEKKKTLTKYL